MQNTISLLFKASDDVFHQFQELRKYTESLCTVPFKQGQVDFYAMIGNHATLF